jgi:primosomal protein N' (replication factor Y) (superfamily II helicase)
MRVLRVALDVPLDTLFDYVPPQALAVEPGDRIVVPFGTRQRVGIAVESASQSDVDESKLREIARVLEGAPRLPRDWLNFMQFLAGYYQRPFGETAVGALPPRLRSLRPLPKKILVADAPPPLQARFVPSHLPTAAQADAVERIGNALGSFRAFLLHGVTGSGKTEVYLRLIARVLEQGAQALVLVPEISLTPQLEARIRGAFPDTRVVVMHSGLEDVARTSAWLAAATGTAGIVLGTRLAVLGPMPRVGLVVVDEEHDTSFKQQDGLRYSARDAAVALAKRARCPVILGTATPSLETWQNALSGRYEQVELPERAVPGARLPHILAVDLRAEPVEHGLARSSIEAIRGRLAQGEQSLVFINRRGYAPVLACEACGWAAGCSRCTARLVLHTADRCLRCHHCGAEHPIPRFCPTCGNADLRPVGRGTQRIEESIAGLFPSARVVRVDRDIARRRAALADTLEGVRRGEGDILVGTQLLAKGHDFPQLTLVCVLDADNALFSTDYRATERLFATLVQVAGRAGRREEPGEVRVQTRYPAHPLFAALARHDFAGFAASLLAEREAGGFPPFVFELALRAEAKKLDDALEFLREAKRLVAPSGSVDTYDPVPLVITRRAGLERAQLIAQSRSRRALQDYARNLREALQALPGRQVRWHLDVDPIEFA